MSQQRKEWLFENLKRVTERLYNAARRSERDPDRVELLVAAKYATAKDMAGLMQALSDANPQSTTVVHIGENRVQDADKKWSSPELARFRRKVILHMIGHLQTNKAGKVARVFDQVDSIDSLRIASALDRHAGELGRVIPVMIQIKLTSSQSQSGVSVKDASLFLNEVRKLMHLSAKGYMGIAPICDNPEELRPVFREVKRLFDKDFPQDGESDPEQHCYLSLGMSSDFEIAVEEGSNLPRIGSLIFQ